MNNAWTRFLGTWIGLRQTGDSFEEEEYFEAPALSGGEVRVYMRERHGDVWIRNRDYEVRGYPAENPWGWAPADWLPRGCRRISEEEANRPPVGWVPPTAEEIEEYQAEMKEHRLPLGRDEDEPADRKTLLRQRRRWTWVAPW